MKLRKIKNGVHICPEIRLDAPFDAHNGIATYLATDEKVGNTLVSMYLAADGDAAGELEKTANFYRDILHLEVRWGEYEEFVYFSEPFPFGEYMFEWLERRERVPLADAIKRVISLLKILSEAHQRGLYHGRITPNSVLLERTGETFDLRMMGLGVSQHLSEAHRLDINWLDFTINLKGMSAEAVDIYGMAIVLMGLVSGEQGIGSFEATGLLPSILRNGLLQQAMERALALRIDAYSDALTFSQDLEAALLELDERAGEVYVGDLVGFESAVRSLASISEDGQALPEASGVWSSLVDNLEQEARSSLLCSLTSLTAIRAVGEEEADDDVTHVTSMPESVLNMRRIHAAHPNEKTVVEPLPEREEGTAVTSSQPLSSENLPASDELPKDTESPKDAEKEDAAPTADTKGTEGESSSVTTNVVDAVSDAQPAESDQAKCAPEEPQQEASLRIDISEFDKSEDEDDGEDEDDAPTRIMKRPNYLSIRLTQEEPPGADSAIREVISSSDSEEPADPQTQMVKRIREAEVIVSDIELSPNIIYDPNDMLAFALDPELEARENAELEAIEAENAHKSTHSSDKHSSTPSETRKRTHGFSKQQKFVLCTLTLVVLILILTAIIIAFQRIAA